MLNLLQPYRHRTGVSEPADYCPLTALRVSYLHANAPRISPYRDQFRNMQLLLGRNLVTLLLCLLCRLSHGHRIDGNGETKGPEIARWPCHIR